ncbi:MAG: HAD family hydrolase [Clostridiales bacterium]|nr:HAD family hydrolase [Clostridiales bacterium]
MIKTVLFDLDGTLLPMDQDNFVKAYFKNLAIKLAPHGYDPQKLIEGIWAGAGAMVANDGKRLNEEVFWQKFAEIFGDKVYGDKDKFEEFYRNDFSLARSVCGFNPLAAEVVHKLKDKGVRVVLATNPIFPAIATEQRIRWAGLEPTDFELYTTYENIGYCKPNLSYYKEILDRLGCKPEEALMVGNDVSEDMVAAKLGMQVFLLTDCIINKNNEDINQYPNGDFNRLLNFIDD